MKLKDIEVSVVRYLEVVHDIKILDANTEKIMNVARSVAKDNNDAMLNEYLKEYKSGLEKKSNKKKS